MAKYVITPKMKATRYLSRTDKTGIPANDRKAPKSSLGWWIWAIFSAIFLSTPL